MRTVSIKLCDVHACIARVRREWREMRRLSVPCRQFQRDGDSVVTEFNPICTSARPMQSPVANAPYSLAVDSVRNRRCAALLERLNCHSWQLGRGFVSWICSEMRTDRLCTVERSAPAAAGSGSGDARLTRSVENQVI